MTATIFIPATSAFAYDQLREYNSTNNISESIVVDGAYIGTANPALPARGAELIEHEVEYKSGIASAPEIDIIVEWDDPVFEYDFGTVERYDWNTETFEYEPYITYQNGESPSWTKDTIALTFTNRSNREVYVQTEFEKNDASCYKNVQVTTEKDIFTLETAVGRDYDDPSIAVATYTVDGEPDRYYDWESGAPSVGILTFTISDNIKFLKHTCNENVVKHVKNETAYGGYHYEYYCDICGELIRTAEDGEHEHHFVYDQFGRLVCTGCDAIAHEYCIDEDEDGICDECGIERDFCPDCHIGGKCICT